MTKAAVPAIARAETQPQTGFFSRLQRNWKARRKIRQMRELDDHLLNDIGVTRDEVVWASYLPLSKNAAHELDRASYERRKFENFINL